MMYILKPKSIKPEIKCPCFFSNKKSKTSFFYFASRFSPPLFFHSFNGKKKPCHKEKRNCGVDQPHVKNTAWNYYVSGFVDGEGCFSISFRLLSRLKTGIEVRPSFSLAQKKSRKNYRLLKNIRDTFGVGGIRDDQRGCYKYETRSLADIQKKIIPFFKDYPLYTDKYENFILFQEICSRMEKKEHLTLKGLKEILSLSETLNPSGFKRFSRIELKNLLLSCVI